MIPPLTIRNCSFHTGLLDNIISDNDEESVQENDNASVEHTLTEQISKLSVHSMSMDEYISKDSEFGVHQEFDDDQIQATFISDGDEEEPNEETELIHEQPEHTLDEKINSFRTCIEVLSENIFDHYNEIKTLRRLFYSFAEEKRQKLAESLIQPIYVPFFPIKSFWMRKLQYRAV